MHVWSSCHGLNIYYFCNSQCVVCLAAAATMQTFPCGHKVVCRKCLIKTIQVAVSQRCLPLRCVICRDRILTLHHTTQFHSSTFGAAFQHSPDLPSTLIPAAPQVSRTVCSPTKATIPTELFSIITGSRYQGSTTGPLSPNAPGSPVSPCLQGSTDDDILKYAPSDLEAFVNSHNDALNMHISDKTHEQKAIQKCNQRNIATHSKRSEITSHSFMHSQPIKIHPTATDHTIAFMDTSGSDSAVLASLGSGSLTPKSVSASRFLAKFLPRKSKPGYNWFRHEN